MDTITLKEYDVEITGQAAEIERRFTSIAAEMNRTPIHVSREKYNAVLDRVLASYERAMEPLWKSFGTEFRCHAKADCVKAFRGMGADLSRLTAGGEPQLDKAVLNDYTRSPNRAIATAAQNILEAREVHAVLGQLNKWKAFVDLGVVQPTWHQYGTPMGRMSCEGVALQNRVMEVRETVVPEKGWVFLSCDIGQMEYRQWGSLSGDAALKEAFAVDGMDFHSYMGSKVAKYLPAGTDLRKAGKTINFALLYRMSAQTLASQLGCSLEAAEDIIRDYFSIAWQAEQYARDVLEQAESRGSISTYFGRVCRLPDLASTDEKLKREAMKTAWHHHNAGSAADLMKWEMNRVDDELIELGLKEHARWVINMHDEFILEVRHGFQPAVQGAVRSAIGLPVPSWIPLEYKIVIGSNWAELDS